MRHLASFLRAPIGYVVGFIATCLAHVDHLPGLRWLHGDAASTVICGACETFCIRDGVQDDMYF
jgi:hypothetical protein